MRDDARNTSFRLMMIMRCFCIFPDSKIRLHFKPFPRTENFYHYIFFIRIHKVLIDFTTYILKIKNFIINIIKLGYVLHTTICTYFLTLNIRVFTFIKNNCFVNVST